MEFLQNIALWQWWIIAAIILFILEIGFTSFFLFSFGLAAVAVGIIEYFGHLGLIWSLVLFAILGGLASAFIRPMIHRFFFHGEAVHSNVYAHIGREGAVVRAIDGRLIPGLVRIVGEEWSAWADENVKIDIGTRVTVLRTEGNKLVVKPVTETDPEPEPQRPESRSESAES